MGTKGREIVGLEFSHVAFAGPALDMLAIAATVPGVGCVPGRLLYMVRLAAGLQGQRAEVQSVAPDEAADAIEMAGPAWQDSRDTAPEAD